MSGGGGGGRKKKKKEIKNTDNNFDLLFFEGRDEDSANREQSLRAEWQCERWDLHNIPDGRADICASETIMDSHRLGALLFFLA